jgi:hypothetical protein
MKMFYSVPSKNMSSKTAIIFVLHWSVHCEINIKKTRLFEIFESSDSLLFALTTAKQPPEKCFRELGICSGVGVWEKGNVPGGCFAVVRANKRESLLSKISNNRVFLILISQWSDQCKPKIIVVLEFHKQFCRYKYIVS